MFREFARNIVLHRLPAPIAHQINIFKNVRFSPLEKEMRFVGLAKAGGDAIDVGANLGLYSEILSPLFIGVTAIEPQPRLVAYLRSVVPDNVTVIEGVASDGQGTIQLLVPRMRGGSREMWRNDALASVEASAVSGKSSDQIEVARFTLDSLPWERTIDFIKIDVEGHERAVLDGATGLIGRDRPVLLIEIARSLNADAEGIFERLASMRYRSFYISGGKVVPTDVAILDRPSDPVYNFFFVHADDSRLARFS